MRDHIKRFTLYDADFKKLYAAYQDLWALNDDLDAGRFYVTVADCDDPECKREHEPEAAAKAIGCYERALKRIKTIRHVLNTKKRVGDQLHKLETEVRKALRKLRAIE
jgi:hypothetical protein